MIKPGEWHRARYWGRFHINKVAELPEPVLFDSPQWGKSSFRPTIALINWEEGNNARPPLFSLFPPQKFRGIKENKVLWFPYWIGTVGKERFGGGAPMISEEEFLALLREAMRQQFFSEEFLSDLGKATGGE